MAVAVILSELPFRRVASAHGEEMIGGREITEALVTSSK